MLFRFDCFKRSLIHRSLIIALTAAPAAAFAQQNNSQSENEETEVIEVRGIRNSIVQSINNKRYAGSVVDSISSVDIGKLPDTTIADSLQRITGVQITRSGGEGTQVNIRGNGNITTLLNGEQMLPAGSITTVGADFADIPSTMVSGMDVRKSSEAKHGVAGLGGTINLRTNRPFMLEDGYTALAKGEYTRGSLGDHNDGLASAFLGYNNNSKFGYTLNISKSTNYLANYSTGAQGAESGYGGWSFNAAEASNFVQNNEDVNGDGDSNDVYYAFQGHEAINQFIDRDRTGINGSLQYQITDSIQITGDVFYTRLKEHQYYAGFVASQGWQGQTGWFTPDDDGATAYDNIVREGDEFTTLEGNFYTFQAGELQARTVKLVNQTRAIDKEALNTNLQINFDNGGAFTGSLRWLHGSAENDLAISAIDANLLTGLQTGAYYYGVGGEPVGASNPLGYEGVSATLPDGTPVAGAYTQVPVHIAYRGDTQYWDLPNLQVTEPDGTVTTERLGSNIDRYMLRSTNLYGTYQEADMDVFRADVNWANYSDVLTDVVSLDFGLRYGKREVTKQGWIGGVIRTDANGDQFLSRWKDTASQAPATGESFIDIISYRELDEQGMITQISDFHGAEGIGAMYFVNPEAMDDPIRWHEDMYGPHVLVNDAANVYNVEETTQTAYVQANLSGDIGSYTYSGNIGFRYIKTEFDILQSEQLIGSTTTVNGVDYQISSALGILQPDGNQLTTTNDYSDFLPAINLSLNIDDEQKVRVAFTKTVSTHNTDMLAGGLTVNRILSCNVQTDDGQNVFCATSGSQAGNPTLKPNRNTNAEISYEWYFSPTGMLNVGFFWVQQNTAFRTELVERDDIVDTDGVVRGFDVTSQEFTGTVPISTTVTIQEPSYTRGVEIGYQQGFDFLPGFWSGFGVTANYTYSPSSGTDLDYYGDSLPATGSSEHQSNLALWYEKDGLQVRIAHNYRSEMLVNVKREGAYTFAYFQQPTSYLDASVSYDINEMLTVSLQGTNLTEETQERYHQWESNVDKRFFNERRLTAGLQLNF